MQYFFQIVHLNSHFLADNLEKLKKNIKLKDFEIKLFKK